MPPDTTGSGDINADLNQVVMVDTAAMDWQASPSGSVWRKRLFHRGAAEAGQVTSLVRYQPDAVFHAHDHPQGEEILVLEGVFSDEHGDWPAGTLLLNPEGFRHAPRSQQGCLIFVRLRQYAGADRKQLAVNIPELPWQTTHRKGVSRKPLYRHPGHGDEMWVERWEARETGGQLQLDGGCEALVLEGAVEVGVQRLGKHAWLRIPEGQNLPIRHTANCELFIKRSGV